MTAPGVFALMTPSPRIPRSQPFNHPPYVNVIPSLARNLGCTPTGTQVLSMCEPVLKTGGGARTGHPRVPA